MAPVTTVRLLLAIAGLYDGMLGALFLFMAPRIFSIAGIPAPSHWGYVHFAAALLLIFALMFFAAALHPAGNRNLIAFGMLLKIAYVSVVAYHALHGGVPFFFTLFAFCDAAWLLALAWCFFIVSRPAKAAATAVPGATPGL